MLARLLETRTGQQLTTGRRWRLETALGPLLRERGLRSLDELVGAIVAGADPALADAVVEALLNNETFFFRDRASFDKLLGGVIERIAAERVARKRLRIWCAGCSTGQEAYSLAIHFAEQTERWRDWRIDILGTDVSASACAQAREGLYSQFEVQRGLPVRQMIRWFEEAGANQWRVARPLRDAVRFNVASLLDAIPAPGQFDIILCRNVLIYFPEATRRAVFERLAEAAAPGGCLMLGAGETIIGQTEHFLPDADHRGLYIRKSEQPTFAHAPPVRSRAARG